MAEKVIVVGNTAYLEGAKAAVVFSKSNDGFMDSKGFVETSVDVASNSSGGFIDKEDSATVVDPSKGSPITKKEIEFMNFGPKNDLPISIMKKIMDNTIVASNIGFLAKIAYGDGLMVARKVLGANGEIELKEILPSDANAALIFEFIENSNYGRVMQEIANDMVVFNDSFVELALGRRTKAGDKAVVAQVRHRDMCSSRISKQNDLGVIEYHGLSGKWNEGNPDDLIVTHLLDRQSPLYDLRVRCGLVINPDTAEQKATEFENQYMLSLNLPVPGRFYYNRPFWWSIFVDWYDFSCNIPKFKKALLQNQMVLKYHISIHEEFWFKLYEAKGIASTDIEKQDLCQTAFLTQLNDFLSGAENAGKSFVSHFSYDKVNGFEKNDIVIKPLESFIKGGEYIQDSEEATNIICNTMSVHPSLKGATPGKGKSISGTEARELFIISNSMAKDIRDMMLLPLYMAKAINEWDKDIFFFVKNVELTTLDKGTGATKNIGGEKV